MNVIQLIIVVFIGLMVYGLVQKLQKRELSAPFFIVWLLFWLAIGVLVLFPVILEHIATWVGVARGVDVAIYSSILVLFYSTFRIMTRLERIERQNAEVVRQIALDKTETAKN
jgi:hypothetical protein